MAKCECGAFVIWKYVNEKGRPSQWQCFDEDGETVHWDNHSKRKFDRIKASGKPFVEQREKEYVEGYKTMFKSSGEQLTRCEALPVRGDQYKPYGACRDCVPPWEVCPDCPDRIAA